MSGDHNIHKSFYIIFLNLFFSLGFIFPSTSVYSQTTYYSKTSGAWNSSATWSTVGCNATINAATFPNSINDKVIICHNVTINQNVAIEDLTILSAGILVFDAIMPRIFTVSGNLRVEQGGEFSYLSNGSITHQFFIGGSLFNAGLIDFYSSVNDKVGLAFNGAKNSVISGNGNYSLSDISINKNNKTLSIEIQTANFFTNLHNALWTFLRGTYIHNNVATFDLGSKNDFLINQNTIIKAEAGQLDIASGASMLTLEGGLEVAGGIVNIGRSSSTGFNTGIIYNKPAGGGNPEMLISGGTLNVFQGVKGSNSSLGFVFKITAGTVILNSGSIASSSETFKINNSLSSSFTMEGGKIIISKRNTANLSDFDLCGSQGSVVSTAGNVNFGSGITTTSTVFNFTPYPDIVLPNIKVTGPANANISLKPISVNDFKFISLFIDKNKTVDMSSGNSDLENNKMTLTGTYDGIHTFYDTNSATINSFKCRSGTVVIESSGEIQVNTNNPTQRYFYILSCAFPSKTNTSRTDIGISKQLILNGGVFTSAMGNSVYLYSDNPLFIAPGSVISVNAIVLAAEAISQDLLGYNYNCGIIIGGNAFKNVNQRGNVSCEFIEYNGLLNPNNYGNFLTNNYDLTINNDLTVGMSSGTTNNKCMKFGYSKVIVKGNILIEKDGSIEADTSKIFLDGNFTNKGSLSLNFLEESSTIYFTGSGDQTLIKTLSGREGFYKIEINKPSGNILLTSTIIVQNSVTFKKGNLVSTSTAKILFEAGSISMSPSDSSYVSGPVQKKGIGSFNFPIGKGGGFHPLNITPAGAITDIYTSEYFNKNVDPLYPRIKKAGDVSSIIDCEYWTLTRDAGTTETKVRLPFGNSVCDREDSDSFSIVGWDGTQWTNEGRSNVVGDSVKGSIESSLNVSSYTAFTFMSCKKPVVIIDGPATFCEGDSLKLTAPASPGYLWSTKEIKQSIQVKASGSYAVSISGACNKTSLPLVVTVNPKPSVPNASDAVRCGPGMVSLSASGSPDTYGWYEVSAGGDTIKSGLEFQTNVSKNSTFYVSSISEYGCESLLRDTIDVSIFPIPAIPFISSKIICGQDSVTLKPQGQTKLYNWYTDSSAVLPFLKDSILNINKLTSTTSYFVSSVNSQNCESKGKRKVTVVKDNIPPPPQVSPVSLCGPGTAVLQAKSSAPSYEWYATSTDSNKLKSGSVYNALNIKRDTVFFVNAVSAYGCKSKTRSEAKVYINFSPLAPVVNDTGRCGQGTIKLQVLKTTYKIKWYNSHGFITENPVLTIVNLTKDSIFYVSSVSDSSCESKIKQPIHVKVYPLPTTSVSINAARCGTGTITISVSAGGTSYEWYDSNNNIIDSIHSNDFTVPQLSRSTTFSVYTLSDNGCKSKTAAIVKATINPLPPVANSRDRTTCDSTKLTLAASGSSYQYSWYRYKDDSVSLSDLSTYSTDILRKSTSFYVTSRSANNCESITRTKVSVIVNPLPSLPQGDNVSVCDSGVAKLKVIGLGKFKWYKNLTDKVPVDTGDSYTTPFLYKTRNYYASSISNEGCESRARSVVKAIIINSPYGPIGVSKFRCGPGKITLEVLNDTGRVVWFAGATLKDTIKKGLVYITDSLNNSKSLFAMRIGNGGCFSRRTEVYAKIIPIPKIPVYNNDSACGPARLLLQAYGGQTGFYNWYASKNIIKDTIPIALTAGFKTPLIDKTTIYYSTVSTKRTSKEDDYCESPRIPVKGIINPIPPDPATKDTALCGPHSITLYVQGSPYLYRWYNLQSDSLSETGNSLTTPPIASNTSFFVSSVSSAGCISSTRKEIRINVHPVPALPQSTGSSRCGPGKIILKAASPGNNYKFLWYSSLLSTIPLDSNALYTTDSVSETRSYFVSSFSDKGCSSVEKLEVISEVKKIPDAPEVTNNTRCGPGDILLQLKESPGNYIWYDQSRNNILSKQSTLLIKNVKSDSTFYVVANLNNCQSEPRKVIGQIIRIPAAPVVKDTTVCKGASLSIKATGSVDNYNWFNNVSEKVPVSKGPEITLTSIKSSQVLYVSSFIAPCESEKVSVTITVVPIPETPVVINGERCGAGKVFLSVRGEASDYLWYNSLQSDTVLYKGPTFMTDSIDTSKEYFVKAEVQSVCQSEKIKVSAIIYAPTIPGIVLGDTNICSGVNKDSITLKDFVGNVVRWQWSLDNFVKDTNNIVSVRPIYYYKDLKVTTSIRAIVKSGICNEISSTPATITILPPVDPGKIEKSRYLIKSNNEGALVLQNFNGRIVKWESSTDDLKYDSVSGATDKLYYHNVNQTLYYKVLVATDECGAKYSPVIKLSVKSLPLLAEDTVSASTNTFISSVNSVLLNDVQYEGDPLAVSQAYNIKTLAGGTFTIDKEGRYTYRPPTDFQGNDSIVYTACIDGIDTAICAISKIRFLIRDESVKIYPTISPNGDHLNDEWIINYIEKYPDNKVSIYDRWGNLIYEEKGYNNKTKVWKGNTNKGWTLGESLPEGTYFYSVELPGINKINSGYVVLKR